MLYLITLITIIYRNINFFFQLFIVNIFSFIFGVSSYDFIIEADNVRHYLGDINSGKNCLKNDEINLNIIINCTYDLHITYPNKDIILHRIPISDININKSNIYLLNNIDDILKKINESIELIKNTNDDSFSILWHCRNGCQRSATCLSLFFLKYYKSDITELIKKTRKMGLKPFLFKKCVNEYKKKCL